MLNIDMNSIVLLILKNGLTLFSLRIRAICCNVYMYKMKVVSKSQYTNYFIWRLVVHHQCNFATSKKLINFWSKTMDIAKYLKSCILAYINIPTPSTLENFSVFIRHSLSLRQRFFIALLTRMSSKKLIKQWKKLIFNVNAALFHNYNLINYFRKYIYHHFKTLNGKIALYKINSMFPWKIP